MKIVLYGATGKAGSRILTELRARKHQVTCAVRNPARLPAGVTGKQDDLSDLNHTARVIVGADAVVSAYGPPPEDTNQLIGVTELLVDAVRQAGIPRLIVVGGAASLDVAPGLTLLASGHLPTQWVPIATAHARTLELLRASDINWTYFSPAGFFEPGERTGKFRLGQENLISDAAGQSRISMEDYAIALVDELEKPAHERVRFTIGY
jgi:uncharacterized protein